MLKGYTVNSMDRLKLLAQSEVPIIERNARFQLDRYGLHNMDWMERDIHEFYYKKTNLILLLEALYKKENNVTPHQFAKWCHTYWSKWRSDENDLFNQTEEKTIDTVIEISRYYQLHRYKAEEFCYDASTLNKWLAKLDPDWRSRRASSSP